MMSLPVQSVAILPTSLANAGVAAARARAKARTRVMGTDLHKTGLPGRWGLVEPVSSRAAPRQHRAGPSVPREACLAPPQIARNRRAPARVLALIRRMPAPAREPAMADDPELPQTHTTDPIATPPMSRRSTT